ncbi:MAG: hypothetical protein K6G56_04260 [Clostridiales bacterium]|nr:hypothetical protein [Clostridiales bacterium]
MKITKLTGYKPGYPDKRGFKKAALAGAAALLAVSAVGCGPRISGDMAVDDAELSAPTEETCPAPDLPDVPDIEGKLAVDPGLIDPAEDPDEMPPLLGKVVAPTEVVGE